MKLNENLFQLGLDAHIKAVEIADSDPVSGYEGKIWQNIYRTKFAELIVKECIKEIDPENDTNSMEDYRGRQQAIKIIKTHFGIE